MHQHHRKLVLERELFDRNGHFDLGASHAANLSIQSTAKAEVGADDRLCLGNLVGFEDFFSPRGL